MDQAVVLASWALCQIEQLPHRIGTPTALRACLRKSGLNRLKLRGSDTVPGGGQTRDCHPCAEPPDPGVLPQRLVADPHVEGRGPGNGKGFFQQQRDVVAPVLNHLALCDSSEDDRPPDSPAKDAPRNGVALRVKRR